MNLFTAIATIIGYIVVIAMAAGALALAILSIQDRYVAVKEKKAKDLETRFCRRLDEIQRDIADLMADLSGIESVVDQFRPAPGYEVPKTQQEGDGS